MVILDQFRVGLPNRTQARGIMKYSRWFRDVSSKKRQISPANMPAKSGIWASLNNRLRRSRHWQFLPDRNNRARHECRCAGFRSRSSRSPAAPLVSTRVLAPTNIKAPSQVAEKKEADRIRCHSRHATVPIPTEKAARRPIPHISTPGPIPRNTSVHTCRSSGMSVATFFVDVSCATPRHRTRSKP